MSESLLKRLSNVNSSELLGVVAARDLLVNADWKPVRGDSDWKPDDGDKFQATITFPPQSLNRGDLKTSLHVNEYLHEAGGFEQSSSGNTSRYIVKKAVKDKIDMLGMIHDTGTRTQGLG